MQGVRDVVMDAASSAETGGAGGGGGAGAQPAGAAAAPPSPAGAATGGGDGGAGDGSLLAQGAGEAQGLSWLPEQFRVKDGEKIDLAASARKLAESYTQLQTVTRSAGLPPKEPTDYKVTVPEALAGKWDPSKDARLGEFQKKAHALGLSQKQFDLVLGEFFDRMQALPAAQAAASFDQAKAELQKVWATPEAMRMNLGAAYHATKLAANAAFDGDAEALARLTDKFGNDPDFLRFAAYWGHQAREDASPDAAGGIASQFAGQTLDQLVAQKVAMEREGKTRTPEYEALARLVAAKYRQRFGEAEPI